MSRTIDRQIEDALELLLYAERYRGSILSLVLAPGASIRAIVHALRVFELAQIRTIVFTVDYETLAQELQTLSRRGIEFLHCPVKQSISVLQTPKEDVIPVYALGHESSVSEVCRFAFSQLAMLPDPQKVFICGGLDVQDTKVPALLNPEELSNVSADFPTLGLSTLTPLIEQYCTSSQFDVVLLPADATALFQEVFTHMGAGTMVTTHSPNAARPAEMSDVLAITQLMRPYAQDGLLLPMSEESIAARVSEFMVYTIHGAVVGAARLTRFGSSGEIGSVCTLPRYRGKGLARDLVLAILEQARSEQRTSVFALSTSEQMISFFCSLGMREIDRNELPAEWQAQYDLNRPSRAVAISLM